MKSSSRFSFPLAGFILLATSGCHFKSPRLSEQQALAAKGALKGNTTDWAAAPLPRGQQMGDGMQAGIPDYTRAAAPIDALSHRVIPEARVQREVAVVQQEVSHVDPVESPLDRVARSCPGSETEVNDALRTPDRSAQIKKYQTLLQRCPASSDLWVWLGVDYQRDGKLDLAKHAFEQAVLLNPSDQEAKGYLSAVQRKLADSMR